MHPEGWSDTRRTGWTEGAGKTAASFGATASEDVERDRTRICSHPEHPIEKSKEEQEDGNKCPTRV